MSNDLTQEIKDAAAAPQSTSNDGVQTTERPIRDLIEADRYLAAKEAANRGQPGIRFHKLGPPSAL